MQDNLVGCSDYDEPKPAPGPTGLVTANEYRLRTNALKSAMARKRIDVALLQYSRDIYYYGGVALHSSLIISLNRDPILLVRMNVSGARGDSWIADIRESSSPADVQKVLQELDMCRGTIGIEEDMLSVAVHRKLSSSMPGAKFADISPLILDQRMVKSAAEVAQVKKAARISRIGFRKAEAMMRPGVSEVAIASEMETAKRIAGHDGFNMGRRPGIMNPTVFVASGRNGGTISGYWITAAGTGMSPAYPYGPSPRRLRLGDLVAIDHGTVYRGYHCDQGRTYVVGPAKEKHKRLFDVLLRAQDAAIQAVKPGVPASQVYDAAWKVVSGTGFERFFMGIGQYGIEFLGHGVGLEIDEPPMISPGNQTLLEEGMTLALEPKFIVPGWGGVDLEDTVVVTCNGCELLTEGKRDLMEVGP